MSKKLKNNQRYIYVLLSKTNTVVARLIRLYTKEPYSHVSIALDAELNELYSFARKQRFNPLNSGFIKEDLEKGVFGADKSTICCVYEVPVTEEQYQHMRKEITHFVDNEKNYGYNYAGLFGAMFGINRDDGIHYMCSQFVTHVFNTGGVKLFPTEKGLVRPFDFHIRLKDKQIYDGKLCEYRDYLKAKTESDYKQKQYAKAM